MYVQAVTLWGNVIRYCIQAVICENMLFFIVLMLGNHILDYSDQSSFYLALTVSEYDAEKNKIIDL